MNKYLHRLIAISSLMFAGNTFACPVPFTASDDLGQFVEKQGGWPVSDAKCEFLRKNGLRLAVTEHYTVLSGTSVGWVALHLVDKNNIRSDDARVSTYVNSSNASMDLAKSLVYSSLKEAIENFNLEKAAKQIAAYQKAFKR